MMKFLKKLSNKTWLIITGIFFIAGLITLPDYGINWDTINHLPRGQVYLHYFLTGKKDYSDFPDFFKEWQKLGEWYWQKGNTIFFKPDIPKESVPRVSLYQRAGVDFNYFMKKDGGHPPLSDILSSFFNYILFQKLGIINDVDSYRIYGILLATSLVGLIFSWVRKNYGSLSAGVSALSLSLYPLFWSESHFNGEKDIPETVYLSFFLFSIWQTVKKKNWKWMILTGIFFGLALGTKFNILFSLFIFLPWILIVGKKVLVKKWFWISSITAILIGLTIFMGSWPYLWADPVARIQEVFGFYKEIGTEAANGINTYPILGVLYTTPILILILFFFGVAKTIKDIIKKKNYELGLLALIWFCVTMGRVIFPGASIYGGLRQIMEYIPAMTILSGIGAGYIALKIKEKIKVEKQLVEAAFVVLTTILLLIPIIKIHPNQNAYFNFLIGGLSGAKEKNFPYWGNTFGAAYRQAADWVNQNAEKDANMAYAYELIPNIPRIWIRTDINLHNSNRSGYLRKGEYVITLPYQGTEDRSYFDMYLRKFLKPVYESKVDGVSVVTVWKNDNEHLNQDWNEKIARNVKLDKTANSIVFTLPESEDISRLEINYGEWGCSELEIGKVFISLDGNLWTGLPGVLPRDWLIPVQGQQPKEGKFIYPFVGQNTKYIRIEVAPEDTCLKNIVNYNIFYIE